MNSIAEDNLMHYGTPRHSGRYPWGSGDNPYQRSGDFLSRIEELKNQGLTETEIAKAMGMSTTQYRAQKSLAKDERRALDVARAKSLREDGLSLNEIAREMGFANDSSVRSLLNERSEARMNQAKKTAEFLKEQIAEKGMIDVGTGVERELGISKEKLKEALAILEAEGYPVYGGRIQQATNPGKHTTLQVVCPPGTEHKEIYDYDNIHSVKDYISYDDGESFRKSFVYPESMDSSRLKIRYAEDGGIEKDGVIEIRRGVEDLSLGESHYAQVRILVDGNRYLKGMAVYSDDLPDGVDVVFNTNKKQGTPTGDVLKKITNDPENPFGSLIKEHGGQSYYDDPNGKYTDPVTGKKQSLSLINKRAEEGDWGEFANGVVDYMTLTFMHDDVLDVKTGQIVRQGEKIGDEGGFGGGRPNRFGAHLHIEASRGRNIAYQVQNGAGTYCTPNQVNIWDALWVGGDVQILKDGGYSWKRDVKKEENDMEFLEVTSERCEVFTEANVNSVDRTFNNGRLVKGAFYPIQSDVGTDGVYHWVRIQAGDKKRYAVVLEDRSKIVSLSAGDAIAACMAQAPHVDTSELEKKLADMTAEKNAVEKRLADVKA